MQSLSNSQVAETLMRLGNLYVAANDSWRAKTFLGAAKIVSEVEGSLDNIKALKGIGKSTAEAIHAIRDTGTCPRLTKLERDFPPDALTLTAIEGVGPKGAYAMCRKYGVCDLDELIITLENSGTDDHLLKLARLGKFHSAQGRLPRLQMKPLVEKLSEALRAIPGVQKLEPAGSYRRECATIRDVDLLVQAESVSLPKIQKVFESFGTLLAAGKKKMRLRHEGQYRNGYGELTDFVLYVDLLVVEAKSWGSALCYFTGSKNHNVDLRTLALEKGIHVSEHGIYEGTEADEDRRIGGAKETDLYEILGIPFVGPKDRDV